MVTNGPTRWKPVIILYIYVGMLGEPPPNHAQALADPPHSADTHPCCACGATTLVLRIPSMYVWTPWRHCCFCYCPDRLQWHEAAAGTRMWRSVHGTRWTTSFASTCDYIGPRLLQLFFDCSVCLVVMIHDFFYSQDGNDSYPSLIGKFYGCT